MSPGPALVHFITALLPGDARARLVAETAASGRVADIAELYEDLFDFSADSTTPPDSALNLVMTYLLTLADIPYAFEHPEAGLENWHNQFAALLAEKGGEPPSLDDIVEKVDPAIYPAVMPLIPLYQTRFLTTGHTLIWLSTGWENWLILALSPEVARCWDGVMIELGNEKLEILSALDKAAPYILAERPDLAMLLRGLPTRRAEDGETCPAFPALSEAP